MASLSEQAPLHPGSFAARFNAWLCGVLGFLVLAACGASAVSLLTWQIADPSLTHAASGPVRNALGPVGAIMSDLIMQLFGLAGVFMLLPPIFWALQLIGKGRLDSARAKLMLAPVAILLLACAAASLPRIGGWPLPYNVGGLLGNVLLRAVTSILAMIRPERASAAAGLFCFAGGMMLLMTSLGLSRRDLKLICQAPRGMHVRFVSRAWQRLGEMSENSNLVRREPTLRMPVQFAPRVARQPAPQFAPVFPYHAPARAPVRPVPPPAAVAPAPAFSQVQEDAYAERSEPATFDNDVDRKNLDRILSICAPKGAKAATRDRTPAADLMPPAPLEPSPYQGPVDAVAPRPVRQAPVEAGAVHQVAAWPVSEPIARPQPPLTPPANGWRPQSLPGGDDLYGRAVAIVLDDRKATANYLQQRLAIGYMRATDLIERMEREGILGAPVYNGMRPILIGGPGSREI